MAAAAERGTDKFVPDCATLHSPGNCTSVSLPRAQKSIVDEATEKGLLDYDQTDQVKAVSEIVELIAVDPPIAIVTRLISVVQQSLSRAMRRKNEDLNSFVSRFRGLAAEHLMHAGPYNSSQIGEVACNHPPQQRRSFGRDADECKASAYCFVEHFSSSSSFRSCQDR